MPPRNRGESEHFPLIIFSSVYCSNQLITWIPLPKRVREFDFDSRNARLTFSSTYPLSLQLS
jgi:hypothetical protein